jgi:hypothetical protein
LSVFLFCASLARHTRALETMAAKHFGEAVAGNYFGKRGAREAGT